MFLTRFRVNTARSGARRLLSSPQAMHAAVMSSFPHLLPTDRPSPDAPRVLWRVDQRARAEVLLYIVSPDRPDLTHLVEQAGWPAAAADDPQHRGWQTKPYGPFLERLSTGDHWAFRLTANPVHTVRRTEDEPRKITAHLTPIHQMGWLLDPERQKRGGFRILEKPHDARLLPDGTTHRGHRHHGDRYELSVGATRTLTFNKSRVTDGSRRSRPVTLVTVTFEGRLEVTDPEALRRTLTQGIGRARAYGCGLLTLAPIPQATRQAS
ncbi:CRISPR-associated protein Cse3 [Streptomyces sp. F-3]|jgi:CRISPR system Cascade subunit CasE|uniref:Type I-E CRISPR-associated protein Cas6/Cse3/CasE n=1 Tax=Streptomyces thermogriseus TaxID=75292 RepID=A0ABP4DGW9_9ACTN|nr:MULTISPECIES: type I-E CRISPR-associated protein Cas6/Cse3/CasE [unclassified Streptomyces]MDN5382586.1 type I-E CRISPR-associated protein Cas6/Cse3/CasE [Streptomyces sp. LB8]GAT81879.1 CRISPR-associated protein Cse3 [Streptomyces sp. F-3]